MVLLSPVEDFIDTDEGSFGINSDAFRRAVDRAIVSATEAIDRNGPLDIIATYRTNVVAVVRRDVDGQTDVIRFDLLCRM